MCGFTAKLKPQLKALISDQLSGSDCVFEGPNPQGDQTSHSPWCQEHFDKKTHLPHQHTHAPSALIYINKQKMARFSNQLITASI